MFQDYALFPHRDVAANVAFGLEMRRDPAPDRAARVARGARAGRPARLRAPVGVDALGRRAPAGRAGPGAGPVAGAADAGRAARGARPDVARAARARAVRAVRPPRHRGDLRDPRPHRGAGAGRPRRGHGRRAGRPGGATRAAVGRPGHAVRGPVPRSHQPVRARARRPGARRPPWLPAAIDLDGDAGHRAGPARGGGDRGRPAPTGSVPASVEAVAFRGDHTQVWLGLVDGTRLEAAVHGSARPLVGAAVGVVVDPGGVRRL